MNLVRMETEMSASAREAEIISLREQIRTTFPAEKFEGTITPMDGELTEEFDEEKDLYDTLRDLTWPEIPAAFIRANPDGFVLLTDAACAAFLPAWLMQSLDAEDENIVREFVSYAFSPTPILRLISPAGFGNYSVLHKDQRCVQCLNTSLDMNHRLLSGSMRNVR